MLGAEIQMMAESSEQTGIQYEWDPISSEKKSHTPSKGAFQTKN